MVRTRGKVMLISLALVSLASVAAPPAGPSLLAWELKSLDEPETHALSRYAGKPLLMVFFKPECSWCFRQVKAINEMRGRCGDAFTALAVGVNGNRSALKQELRRLRPEFPAYEASPELLAALGGVPATPFTLVGDAQGDYLNWLRGFIPLAELEAVAELEAGFQCPQPAA